jgi:hypothetical protein
MGISHNSPRSMITVGHEDARQPPTGRGLERLVRNMGQSVAMFSSGFWNSRCRRRSSPSTAPPPPEAPVFSGLASGRIRDRTIEQAQSKPPERQEGINHCRS